MVPANTPSPDDLLRPAEVAKMFGVSVHSVTRYALSGQIPAVRLGEHGNFRFRRADVEAFLRPVRPVSA